MPELIAPSRLYLQTGAGMGKTVVTAWYSPWRTDNLRMVMMQGTWDDSIDARTGRERHRASADKYRAR